MAPLLEGEPGPFTLAGLIRSLASTRPDRPALTAGSVTLDFRQLDERSSRVAQGLIAAGVDPGDRVAIISRNCIPYYEVLLGVSKVGAVVVGVNFRLAPPEVAEVLADAEPALVFAGVDQLRLIDPGREAVAFGSGYESWLAGHPPVDPMLSAPDDVVLQLYSSGTTGTPKGACLTNANLSWTTRMGRECYAMSDRSVNLLTSPLFHIGGAGYILTAFGQGGHTVLAADMDPVGVLELIAAHRVTHAFLVPSVIRMLLDALADHPVDLSSLELIAYGASPIDERTLREAVKAFGSRFLGVYGMTETAGSVTALMPADHNVDGPRAHLLRSVGRPLPWHEVEVFDAGTGTAALPGEVGELWVRSSQNMPGYWRRPDLNEETLRPDGWLRTGDAAWRDEEGYLFIHDRLKDMIISGGENVYPAEVERVLAAHPGVREVVVVGVPHPRWGETVKAVVVPAAGGVEEADLIAFARERLAHYKCPTSVDLVSELPRNASGKLLKRSIRARYWPAQEGGTAP
jgi:long-chain acyl-CoA synthetase